MTYLLMLLGYIWSIPNTLIALALAIPYDAHDWKWSDGCLEATTGNTMFGGRRVGAQTFGWVIFYRDNIQRERKDLRVHERVHVAQGMIGGPLFLVAYAANYLANLVRYRDWWEAYRKVWFEVQAYEIQHQYLLGNKPDAWGSK